MEQESEGFSGKNVLISGGTTGIGRAIAIKLAQEGANVFVFGRHEQELQDALADIGDNGQGMVADQANPEDVAAVFERFDQEVGDLDIMINNAAIGAASVVETEPDEIGYTIKSNLIGPLLCCHYAVKRLQEREQGDILNIGSMSNVSREEDSDIYVATKSGLDGFTTSLRKKLVDDNIRVSLIEPGLVGTDMTVETASPEEQPEWIAEAKMLKAEDIAEAALFILRQPRRCDVIRVQVQPHKSDS
jgi:NAD(P)-dependent dehydrogenase (short-subunit alcohol dehydrogenase family)